MSTWLTLGQHQNFKRWESKHNTWEPIENLAGCEDMIAEMKELRRQKDAELEAEVSAARGLRTGLGGTRDP